MTDLVALQKKNDARWKAATITRPKDFESVAHRAVANKARYVDIIHRLRALGSTMPDKAWIFIAATHYRESNMDFNTHLGQGDPLTDKHGNAIYTVHVPAHRGLFTGPDAFEKAAVDALWYCAPYAAKSNKDWTISGQITYEERYNGLAYANAGIPSPYVWSGTNQYRSGKVLVDHGPIVMSVVDKQVGVAGIFLAIMAIDPETAKAYAADVPTVSAPSIVGGDIMPSPGVFDAVWVQWALNELGVSPRLVQDGIVGSATRTATEAFQASHGLDDDGKAGKLTIAALQRELESKSAALKTQGA